VSSPALARRDLVALTLAAAAWGVGTVISKRALDEIPPLTLLPVQLAASLTVLAVLMRRRGLPLRGSPAILGRLGVLNPGLAYALGLLGLGSITASLAVLLWAVEPLMILILAIWLLRERVAPVVGVLSLAAVVGLALLVYEPSTNGQWSGVALTLTGVACCATYTIVTRRWIAASDSTAQVVFAQQAHALVFALIVVAFVGLMGGEVRPTGVSAIGLLSAISSGVLYYAGAYWLYLTALRSAPASMAAISFYLIPLFGVAGGILLLGEGLDPRQWVGAAIVLIAVLVITFRPNASEAVAAAAAPDPATSGSGHQTQPVGAKTNDPSGPVAVRIRSEPPVRLRIGPIDRDRSTGAVARRERDGAAAAGLDARATWGRPFRARLRRLTAG
jgi:probable blue pigment (indigoidine) exporter